MKYWLRVYSDGFFAVHLSVAQIKLVDGSSLRQPRMFKGFLLLWCAASVLIYDVLVTFFMAQGRIILPLKLPPGSDLWWVSDIWLTLLWPQAPTSPFEDAAAIDLRRVAAEIRRFLS